MICIVVALDINYLFVLYINGRSIKIDNMKYTKRNGEGKENVWNKIRTLGFVVTVIRFINQHW